VRSLRTHFGELFESSDQRRALLLDVADTFFHDLNLMMVEYILLQQCKLTDPASMGKDKDNLTTNYILGLDWSDETRTVLVEANARLTDFREKILDARRKLIAHLDVRARLNPVGLGEVTRAEELAFWEHLQTFADAAHREALGGPFEIAATMQSGDISSLVHALKDAVEYQRLVDADPALFIQRYSHDRYRDA
jgi:hypothetical protein